MCELIAIPTSCSYTLVCILCFAASTFSPEIPHTELLESWEQLGQAEHYFFP